MPSFKIGLVMAELFRAWALLVKGLLGFSDQSLLSQGLLTALVPGVLKVFDGSKSQSPRRWNFGRSLRRKA